MVSRSVSWGPVGLGPSTSPGGSEEFAEALEDARPPAGSREPEEEILTPADILAWLRFEPDSRWLEKNINRIPGRFKAGRNWRFRKVDILINILRTGRVLMDKPKRGRG